VPCPGISALTTLFTLIILARIGLVVPAEYLRHRNSAGQACEAGDGSSVAGDTGAC
jgi:hypothetical protein